MTIAEFLDVSVETLEHMSTADLRRIAATGQRYSNRRITSLKEAKMTASMAYQALPQKVQKGGFKTENLSRNRLINAINAEQRFMRSKTSTVKGWKSVKNEIYKEFGIKKKDRTGRFGYNKYGQYVPLLKGEKSLFTRKQIDLYWQLYWKGVESGYIGSGTSSKPVTNEQLADILVTIVKDHSRAKKVSDEMENELQKALEEMAYEQEDAKSANAAEIRSAGVRANFKKSSK